MLKRLISVAAALVGSLVLTGAALATNRPHRLSLSLYEHTASASVLAHQGCSAARRGESGVVVLDFGKPAYGHHSYGTIDFASRFISNHEITIGMLGWAR